MRHRLILSYEALSDNVTSDALLTACWPGGAAVRTSAPARA